MENEQKNQLQRANEALKQLAKSVTAKDRQAAMLNYSQDTVIKYLKGRGKNLDTAMTLFEFFKNRIEERDKALQDSNAIPAVQ